MTPAARAALLKQMSAAIEEHYLDPAKAKQISSALTSRKTRARLSFKEPVVFSREATAILYEISGDRHLSVKWTPTNNNNTPGSALPLDHHGLGGVQFLPGNIGLLTLDRFYNNREARESLTAALFLLRDSAGLVFDFRENRGGASDAVRLLQSCFFSKPALVMTYEDKPGKRTPSFTEAPPAGISCSGKPFYILTSGRTASAAEDFIYTAKLRGHGLVVGEQTSGAANFITHHRLAMGFRMAVSVGRPVHPETGSNWEGEGIAPDIPIDAEHALARAHDTTLEKLLSRPGGASDQTLRYFHNAAHAKANPLHLTNAALRAFVGRYGDTRVALSVDGLMLHSQTGTRSRLSPLRPDIFAIDNTEAAQLIFHHHEIGVTYAEFLYPDGTREFVGVPD